MYIYVYRYIYYQTKTILTLLITLIILTTHLCSGGTGEIGAAYFPQREGLKTPEKLRSRPGSRSSLQERERENSFQNTQSLLNKDLSLSASLSSLSGQNNPNNPNNPTNSSRALSRSPSSASSFHQHIRGQTPTSQGRRGKKRGGKTPTTLSRASSASALLSSPSHSLSRSLRKKHEQEMESEKESISRHEIIKHLNLHLVLDEVQQTNRPSGYGFDCMLANPNNPNHPDNPDNPEEAEEYVPLRSEREGTGKGVGEWNLKGKGGRLSEVHDEITWTLEHFHPRDPNNLHYNRVPAANSTSELKQSLKHLFHKQKLFKKAKSNQKKREMLQNDRQSRRFRSGGTPDQRNQNNQNQKETGIHVSVTPTRRTKKHLHTPHSVSATTKRNLVNYSSNSSSGPSRFRPSTAPLNRAHSASSGIGIPRTVTAHGGKYSNSKSKNNLKKVNSSGSTRRRSYNNNVNNNPNNSDSFRGAHIMTSSQSSQAVLYPNYAHLNRHNSKAKIQQNLNLETFNKNSRQNHSSFQDELDRAHVTATGVSNHRGRRVSYNLGVDNNGRAVGLISDGPSPAVKTFELMSSILGGSSARD